MKFLKIEGLVVNLEEIEYVINDQGPAATLAFRSGQRLPVSDAIARKIVDCLNDKKLLIAT